MQILYDRIRKDGIVRAGNVLKVDRFLNHQMDIHLFQEIGRYYVAAVLYILVSYSGYSRPIMRKGVPFEIGQVAVYVVVEGCSCCDYPEGVGEPSHQSVYGR